MNPDTHQGLQEKRANLTARLHELESGGPASSRELRDVQYLVRQLDALLKLESLPAEAAAPDGVVHLLRIAKGARAEVRVSVCDWKGKKRIELRQWNLARGSGEWQPTRRGASFGPGDIEAVIGALQGAMESMNGALPDA